MKVTIRGVKYVVEFAKRLSGNVVGLWTPGRIQLQSGLVRDELMQIALHEGLHACQADLSEEAVEEIAIGLTEILWGLGFRRAEL